MQNARILFIVKSEFPGYNGKCSPFSPLFYLLCCIHHSHTVYLLHTKKAGDSQAKINLLVGELWDRYSKDTYEFVTCRRCLVNFL